MDLNVSDPNPNGTMYDRVEGSKIVRRIMVILTALGGTACGVAGVLLTIKHLEVNAEIMRILAVGVALLMICASLVFLGYRANAFEDKSRAIFSVASNMINAGALVVLISAMLLKQPMLRLIIISSGVYYLALLLWSNSTIREHKKRRKENGTTD